MAIPLCLQLTELPTSTQQKPTQKVCSHHLHSLHILEMVDNQHFGYPCVTMYDIEHKHIDHGPALLLWRLGTTQKSGKPNWMAYGLKNSVEEVQRYVY